MPEFETLLTFAIAAAILSVSPGPSNLYIMARTLKSGQVAGFFAAGGMAVGSLTFVIMTVLGLSAIFSYSPIAYTGLKLGGAGYLMYLGFLTLRHLNSAHIRKTELKPMTNGKVFQQSIIVELTNPKTALFFIAFLPQFARPESGPVALQLLLLGCIYSFIAFCSDLVVATTSNQIGKWLSTHPKFPFIQDFISGSILLGLGTFIAFSELS